MIKQRYIMLIATLMREAKKKYPVPFDVIPRSQAEMFLNGIYSKIIRLFLHQSKPTFYKGKVSKETIKHFNNWVLDRPIQ